MRPSDALIEMTIKIFVVFIAWIAALTFLDMVLQIATLISMFSQYNL